MASVSRKFLVLCLLCLQHAMNVSGISCYVCDKESFDKCGSKDIKICNSSMELNMRSMPGMFHVPMKPVQVQVRDGEVQQYSCFTAIATVLGETRAQRGCIPGTPATEVASCAAFQARVANDTGGEGTVEECSFCDKDLGDNNACNVGVATQTVVKRPALHCYNCAYYTKSGKEADCGSSNPKPCNRAADVNVSRADYEKSSVNAVSTSRQGTASSKFHCITSTGILPGGDDTLTIRFCAFGNPKLVCSSIQEEYKVEDKNFVCVPCEADVDGQPCNRHGGRADIIPGITTFTKKPSGPARPSGANQLYAGRLLNLGMNLILIGTISVF